MQYWYNVATGQVERSDNRDRSENLMGPYASEAEARNALQSAHDRTDAWDAEEELRRKDDEQWGQTPRQQLGLGDPEQDEPGESR